MNPTLERHSASCTPIDGAWLMVLPPGVGMPLWEARALPSCWCRAKGLGTPSLEALAPRSSSESGVSS